MSLHPCNHPFIHLFHMSTDLSSRHRLIQPSHWCSDGQKTPPDYTHGRRTDKVCTVFLKADDAGWIRVASFQAFWQMLNLTSSQESIGEVKHWWGGETLWLTVQFVPAVLVGWGQNSLQRGQILLHSNLETNTSWSRSLIFKNVFLDSYLNLVFNRFWFIKDAERLWATSQKNDLNWRNQPCDSTSYSAMQHKWGFSQE